MLSWYTLHAKPHKERQVQAVLSARGMQVYFPTVPVTARRGRPTVRAFFPRYLFVRADLEQVGLWTLRYAPGASGVVMFGDTPARVTEEVIAALQTRLAGVDASAGTRRVIVDARGEIIAPGDRVAVMVGPLAEFEAVFDRRLSAAGRVRILIHWLQRWTAVELEASALQKTGALKRPRTAG